MSRNIVTGIFVLLSLIPSLTFSSPKNIIVGAERQSEYLPLLKDKRVGLLVNPTSMVKDRHLVDSLVDNGINVSLIFAPEHGFRGDHGAGEVVKNNRDKKTGVEIVSLHGKIKKPTKEHMSQVDVMIFDIQDVGVRYYTYISSMHYLMEACAESNVPLIVLDRPNPNGDYIDGPILTNEFKSFIGMHPIPIVHGMTVGEMAKMINGEGWLANGEQCDLHVITVANYDHNMTYSLPIKPSPNLPNDLSIRLYPSLGFFEATPVSVGRGTAKPFQILAYPDKRMGTFHITPKKIRGSWSKLNYAGKTLYGESIDIDLNAKGIELDYLVHWFKKFKDKQWELFKRPKFMDKLSGTSDLRRNIVTGMAPAEIKKSWQQDLKSFQSIRKKYLLYRDSEYVERKFNL